MLFALVSVLLPAGAAAAPADAGHATPVEAKAWLSRISSAAAAGNYRGTMVFSAGGTMSSSRVGHYAVGEQVYEQLEALDGRQQRILRHNDAVHTLWPQARRAVVEKRETLAGWSTTPQVVDPQALEQYEFRREGRGRVAGREAVVILLEPRDELRYAQRLWADQATSLLLRADVIGQAAGQGAARPVLESTAFSEITIGIRPQPEAVLQPLRSLDGYRVVRPQQTRTTLEAEGLAITHPVVGFRLVGCVKRGMETAGGEELVLQAVFTDGLAHVSLFIEPFKPQRHNDELQAQRGATGTLTVRRGEDWFTVVGDVPPATLKLFAAAAERRRP
ncbi:MAG: MucB/RseB C-terminal domain-containing protein [Rubrivivax sp.]|nr:MucB/RseB C-terminal domain-containing protein [Rubrivivax sp.]